MQDDKEEKTVDVAPSTVVDDPEQLDWEHVRKLSLRSGGFREERVVLWYVYNYTHLSVLFSHE